MPVTSVAKDIDALTLTIVGDFAVPVERLWDAYADADLLQRFWGPPGWPATFTRHDLVPGGRSDYYMTGPDGERFHGYWDVISVDEGKAFAVRDGFADPDGTPNPEAPSMEMTIRFEATPSGSRFVSVTRFDSADDLEQLVAMGMEEGATLSIGQLDVLLADLREHARALVTEVLSDTAVRIVRFFDHPRDLVWQAHTDPDLIRRWMLGPEGWTMPVCEVDLRPGGAVRYRWERDGASPLEIGGETLHAEPPHRWVTTESMSDMAGPPTTNDLALAEHDGGTLLTLLITYPDAEARDAHLATGMTDGMEAGYRRLETVLVTP